MLPQKEPLQSPTSDFSRSKASIATKPVKAPAKRQGVSTRGNCVATLKVAGLLKCKDCSPTDLAKDIPTARAELAVGEKGVIVTTEGRGTGHVVYAERLSDGTYKSIVEGNHPVGAGRILNEGVVKGVAASGKIEAPKPSVLPPVPPKKAPISKP